MEEVETKKDVVISRFTKTPDLYPANSLKRNNYVFLLPWRKKYKKSVV